MLIRPGASRFLCVALALALAGCANHTATPGNARPADRSANTIDLTLFAINDLHGNLQSDHPTPYVVDDHGHGIPTGGFAYLSAVLRQRQAQVGENMVVAAGDLIGASPLNAALLRDEPVIEAMNRLGLQASALGNHEFDGGLEELQRKMRPDCQRQTCALPDFSGTRFKYLSANIFDERSGKPWVAPYTIVQKGGLKIGLIGATTRDTPNIVLKGRVDGLRFDDEADAINRYVPEMKAAGVDAIVVLIHEGGDGVSAANDPSYACEGLKGPIIGIVKRLDPFIKVVVSGHSHQAYTCKIGDTLVTQARSYGSLMTEIHMRFASDTHRVVSTDAFNYTIDQNQWRPDPEAQTWVERINQLTADVRNRPVTRLDNALLRKLSREQGDSLLGRVIADAMLAYARRSGPADVAFINDGGIRSNLPNTTATGAVDVTYADLVAVQPFGNRLVRLTMTGRQLLALLQDQWGADGQVQILAASAGLSYRWRQNGSPEERLRDVRLNGQVIEPARDYTIIVNDFMSKGGDKLMAFTEGRNPSMLGKDVEALEWYLHENAQAQNLARQVRMRRDD